MTFPVFQFVPACITEKSLSLLSPVHMGKIPLELPMTLLRINPNTFACVHLPSATLSSSLAHLQLSGSAFGLNIPISMSLIFVLIVAVFSFLPSREK